MRTIYNPSTGETKEFPDVGGGNELSRMIDAGWKHYSDPSEISVNPNANVADTTNYGGTRYYKRDRGTTSIDLNAPTSVGGRSYDPYNQQDATDYFNYMGGKLTSSGWSSITSEEYQARQALINETPGREATGADIQAFEDKVANYMAGLGQTAKYDPNFYTPQPTQKPTTGEDLGADFSIAGGKTPVSPKDLADENNMIEIEKNGQKTKIPYYDLGFYPGWTPVQGETKPSLTPGEFQNPDVKIADQSEKMNEMLTKVNEIVTAQPNGIANNAFVQTVAQARYGRAATQQELNQYIGKSILSVVEGMGLTQNVEGMGVSEDIPFKPGIGEKAKQTIRDLVAQVPFSEWGDKDIINYNFATGENLPLRGVERGQAPAGSAGTGGTGADGTGTQKKTDELGGTDILSEYDEFVENYQQEKKDTRSEYEKELGVDEKSNAISEAQTQANEIKSVIDQLEQESDMAEIFDVKEIKDMVDKAEGQTIPLSIMNKQIQDKLDDMTFDQKIDSMVRTVNINSKILAYNSALTQVDIAQGNYDRAMQRVKDGVADWTEYQNMKLDLLEMKGKIQSEERARLDQEIEYQRGLAEKGMIEITDKNSYDQIMKDFNVGPTNWSQFFFKDPATNKIYLKSAQDVAEYDKTFSDIEIEQGKYKMEIAKTQAEIDKIYNDIGQSGQLDAKEMLQIQLLQEEINEKQRERDKELIKTEQFGQLVGDKLNFIDEILNHSGMNEAVGPNFATRTSFGEAFTSIRGNFIAKILQLTAQETMDALTQLKDRGGTLGALSDQERIMLSNAATLFGNRQVKDKNGNVIGYDMTEAQAKAELTKLRNKTAELLNAVNKEFGESNYSGSSNSSFDDIWD